MSKDNSPPVFAGVITHEGPTGNAKVSNGLSLRDYFAAQALPAVLSAQVQLTILRGTEPEDGESEAAKTSYEIADAMLAEREK